MAKQTLKEFIIDWNKTHQYFFSFTPIFTPVTERPIAIEVRFDPKKCRRESPYNNMWPEDYVYAKFFMNKERPFICVARNHDFFEMGIFSVEVLSCSPDYDEEKVVEILKGITEEYFTL